MDGITRFRTVRRWQESGWIGRFAGWLTSGGKHNSANPSGKFTPLCAPSLQETITEAIFHAEIRLTMNTDILSYETLQDIVLVNDLGASAAEIHGILTGLLCLNGSITLENWLEQGLDISPLELTAAARAYLQKLHAETCRQLRELDFSFQLLLPEDDHPLEQRAAALGEWCEGFMFGIGYMSRMGDEWPGDSGEILNDFIQICRITYSSPDDEADFMELSEYVRICTQVIRTEFLQQQQARRLH